jgi:hypothetical protein
MAAQQKIFQESILREIKSSNDSTTLILVVLVPLVLNFLYILWIDEARYLLGKLSAVVNDSAKFKYNLSAFLSAARSPLQYACEEAKSKPGGKTWYDSQIAGNPVVKYFKDKRNVKIHEKPVSPNIQSNILIPENVSISESIASHLFGPMAQQKRVNCSQPLVLRHSTNLSRL